MPIGNEAYLTQILQLISRIGAERLDDVIYRAVKLVSEKGVSINHILAEILVYYYLLSQGYSYISIEESVGVARCDVYAKRDGFDICIEIDFYTVPQNFILNRMRYIVARHIKKMLQIVRSSISAAAFAYPYGLIPLIPTELVKPIDARSRKKLLNIVSNIRDLIPLDSDDVDHLMKVYIHSILIIDIDYGKVYELSPQSIEGLITAYESVIKRW